MRHKPLIPIIIGEQLRTTLFVNFAITKGVYQVKHYPPIVPNFRFVSVCLFQILLCLPLIFQKQLQPIFRRFRVMFAYYEIGGCKGTDH